MSGGCIRQHETFIIDESDDQISQAKGNEPSELSEAFSRTATWRRVTVLMSSANNISTHMLPAYEGSPAWHVDSMCEAGNKNSSCLN